MADCARESVPMTKGDKLSERQAPQNDTKRQDMRDRPYASLVGSLMYAQVCIRPDIAFPISVLGRFQLNPWTRTLGGWKEGIEILTKNKGLQIGLQKESKFGINWIY